MKTKTFVTLNDKKSARVLINSMSKHLYVRIINTFIQLQLINLSYFFLWTISQVDLWILGTLHAMCPK